MSYRLLFLTGVMSPGPYMTSTTGIKLLRGPHVGALYGSLWELGEVKLPVEEILNHRLLSSDSMDRLNS